MPCPVLLQPAGGPAPPEAATPAPSGVRNRPVRPGDPGIGEESQTVAALRNFAGIRGNADGVMGVSRLRVVAGVASGVATGWLVAHMGAFGFEVGIMCSCWFWAVCWLTARNTIGVCRLSRVQSDLVAMVIVSLSPRTQPAAMLLLLLSVSTNGPLCCWAC